MPSAKKPKNPCQTRLYSSSKSNLHLCLIWNWNARQDAVPKCKAFREARRDHAPAPALGLRAVKKYYIHHG